MAQQPISKRCFCSTLTYLSSSFHFQVSHRHRRRRRRRRRRRHRSQVADGGVEQTRESGGEGDDKANSSFSRHRRDITSSSINDFKSGPSEALGRRCCKTNIGG